MVRRQKKDSARLRPGRLDDFLQETMMQPAPARGHLRDGEAPDVGGAEASDASAPVGGTDASVASEPHGAGGDPVPGTPSPPALAGDPASDATSPPQLPLRLKVPP